MSMTQPSFSVSGPQASWLSGLAFDHSKFLQGAPEFSLKEVGKDDDAEDDLLSDEDLESVAGGVDPPPPPPPVGLS